MLPAFGRGALASLRRRRSRSIPLRSRPDGRARAGAERDESDPPPACDEEGVLLEAPPESYENNLESVRFTIRAEPLSSPFYQRPVGIASHPRVIFEPSSTEADLIVEWLTRGAP